MWTRRVPMSMTNITQYRTNPNPRSTSSVKKSAPAIAPRCDLIGACQLAWRRRSGAGSILSEVLPEHVCITKPQPASVHFSDFFLTESACPRHTNLRYHRLCNELALSAGVRQAARGLLHGQPRSKLAQYRRLHMTKQRGVFAKVVIGYTFLFVVACGGS